MKYLIALLLLPFTTPPLSFDFGRSCDNCRGWFVVLDGVMGGLSTGELQITENSFILTGEVSLENNGGFASLRTPFNNYDLSTHASVTIRYRSTGQDFAFTLNKYKRFWYPNYKINLPVTDGVWKEVTYALKDFGRYRMGKKVQGTPDTDDLTKIIRLGFISNTKEPTKYTFEVDNITFN